MDGSNPFVRLEIWLKVSYCLIYIPLVIGFIRFKKLSPLQVRIWALVVLTFFSDTLTYILRIRVESNLWVYHLFIPVLVFAMYKIYERELISAPRYVIRGLVGGVALFSVLNTVFWQGTEIFNSNAIVAAGILFILFSLLYYYELINGKTDRGYRFTPMTWFNTGVLLHYSGTLILFFFVNSIREQSVDIMLFSWVLNMVFTAVLLGFYSTALWVKQRP